MIDDFELFGDNANDGEPIDPDVALLTAYLAHELSAVQVIAVERRLETDAAFHAAVAPLVSAWSAAIPAIDHLTLPAPADASLAATQGELDRGWQQFERAQQADMSHGRRRRAASLARTAAVIALVVGPLLAVAQGVRSFLAHRAQPAPSVDLLMPPRLQRGGVAPESVVDVGHNLAVLPRAGVPDAPGQPGEWRVDSVPVVDIGSMAPAGFSPTGKPGPTGPPALVNLLASLRGAVRLADGRIVVAEFSRGLKFFDANGRYLQSVDRSAFGAAGVINILPYRGDSLFVVTNSATGSSTKDRITTDYAYTDGVVLDGNGHLGRTVHLAATVSTPPRTYALIGGTTPSTGLQGILGDGSFVMGGPARDSASAGGRATYYHVSADGATSDTLATLMVENVGDQQTLFRMQAPPAAVHDRLMYWTDGSRFAVTTFDLSPRPSGAPMTSRTMRIAKEPTRVTDSLRNYYIERNVSFEAARGVDASASRAKWRARASRPVLPAVANTVIDERGNIWLEHYRVSMPFRGLAADPTDIPRWTVLDPAGNEVGEVTMPRGFVVYSIGADWVFGTIKDVHGLDHVRVYPLIK